jgi:hypothetical protein
MVAVSVPTQVPVVGIIPAPGSRIPRINEGVSAFTKFVTDILFLDIKAPVVYIVCSGTVRIFGKKNYTSLSSDYALHKNRGAKKISA